MPNRIIKDSIRTSKTVNTMTDFQFRLWIFLITYVDDFGRGSADPELLKGFVFPRRKGITETTIKKTLAELANIGSVTLYEVDGEPYLCFPNWGEHQAVRNKVSKFPAPEDGKIIVASNCEQLKSSESKCPRNPIQSESNTCANADAFDAFWSAYPKKKNKEDARKAFAKVKAPVETLLAAIAAQKKSEAWTKDKGQFIPYPATWLRCGAWEDELEASESEVPPRPQTRWIATGEFEGYRERFVDGKWVRCD